MGTTYAKLRAKDALKTIMGVYDTYRVELISLISQATNKTAKEETAAIKAEAERLKIGHGNGYIEGIVYKSAPRQMVEKISKVEAVIYNKNKPQIAHLIEKGHDVVDTHGKTVGHAKAFPHFKPNKEKFDEIYVQRIIEAIEKAGYKL